MINDSRAEINWVDGASPWLEARAIKNDAGLKKCVSLPPSATPAHRYCAFIKNRNAGTQNTAFAMNLLYNIPGVEDVGTPPPPPPPTQNKTTKTQRHSSFFRAPTGWPTGGTFPIDIIQPGDW